MSPLDLEGTPWVLASGAGIDIPDGVSPSATFVNGKVSGSTGCNRFSGSYVFVGDRLAIGPLASTLMACPPPLDVLERSYVTALEAVAAWRIHAGVLVLASADGEDLLQYEPASPAGNWEVTGYLSGDAFRSVLIGTTITAEFGAEGQLAGHAGCNRYRATYATDGGGVEISTTASTRMLCSEPAGIMEQEASYLALLPVAASFRVEGRTLELLGAHGARLVSYVRR